MGVQAHATDHSGTHELRNLAQVSCNQTSGRDLRVRSDQLSLACFDARAVGSVPSSKLDAPGPQFGVLSDGCPSSSRTNPEISIGYATGGDPVNVTPASASVPHFTGLQRVLRLVLQNPDNQRYQNAFMLGMMWTTLEVQGADASIDHFCSGTNLGRIVVLVNKLLMLNKPTRLMAHLEWTSYLVGWRQPLRQHDIAEFALHILQKSKPPMIAGSWHSRDSEGGVYDTGDTCQPIAMNITDCSCFQHVADKWSSQPRTHALVNAPQALCVQLCSFTYARRKIKKLHDSIMPSSIHVPVFAGPGSETYQLHYTLAAVALHFGETPTSGHHRCLFLESESNVNRTPAQPFGQEGCYISDDGCSAVPLCSPVAPGIGDVCTCSYLCWFKKA